jgi:hypothetical protein
MSRRRKLSRVALAAGVAALPAVVVTASPVTDEVASAGMPCFRDPPVSGFGIVADATPCLSPGGYTTMQIVFNGTWKAVGPHVTATSGSPALYRPYVACFSGTWKYRGSTYNNISGWRASNYSLVVTC